MYVQRGEGWGMRAGAWVSEWVCVCVCTRAAGHVSCCYWTLTRLCLKSTRLCLKSRIVYYILWNGMLLVNLCVCVCVCVCWTFILPVLVLDVGLYFTLEHYSYLWRVCVHVCARACIRAHSCRCVYVRVRTGMCVWVLFCWCKWVASWCMSVLLFVCLLLSRHFPCRKTWWIKNLNLNLIPYVNCSGRTVLYVCIEYCI